MDMDTTTGEDDSGVVITMEERLTVQRKALEDEVKRAKANLAKYGGVDRKTDTTAPTTTPATNPKRKFGVFMVVDLEDGDPEDTKELVKLLNKRKRRAVNDRDQEPIDPKKKWDQTATNACGYNLESIYVQSGNADVLRSLGVGVGPVEKHGLAKLTLPVGWTMYKRLEWMGTMGHATVIKDEKGAVRCEIVHQFMAQEIVMV